MRLANKHGATWHFSLKSKINLAFGLALLILAVVAFASYRSIVRLRADVNWMEHTYEVSRTIRILLLEITEAETGQRGFVITAKQAFVKRFSLAEQSIPATLDTLRELTKDNPRQQRRMDTLQQLIIQRLAFARENMQTRKQKGLEAAAEMVGTGRGEKLMDQISALIAEMQQEESQLLAERDKATDRTIRETTLVIAAGLLLAFLVVPFASLLTSREIGRRAQAEEALRKAYGDLEAVNKELEAFTYSVSHDLRAPLRHVDGFAKLLCEEFAPQLDATAQHYLSRIQAGTRQMAQLVDDLLHLARVGRQELRRQATGLNSLVTEVVAELKPEAQGRQVDWRIGSLPFVDCDPTLLKHVLANLLSNALKFTRTRPSAIVEVGQLERNGRPVIFVRDNGVGFSMKYADKLFGVFQRLHRAEDFEGTGVGLATVQRIVHKHGGQVWAEAELDKGASFYFTLGSPENTGTKGPKHSTKEVPL
jgi:signal transduction histidine kinase